MGTKNKLPEEIKNSESSEYHVPVLLSEAIGALNIKPSGIYVDCTFGGGGHSSEILKNLTTGKLLVFDQDEAAKANIPKNENQIFIPQNFIHLQRFLRLHNFPMVDGILADLGVSSHQFDEADRGFSTRFDAPLDMRMDVRNERTAATVLNQLTESALHKLFEQYGEVTNSKTLAKTIVSARQTSPFKTIAQLKQALYGIVKGNPNKYFAQVFQALRIEVNDELGALKELLKQSVNVLKPEGRLVIITFHSLEDRIVKNFYKSGTFDEVEDDVYGNKKASPLNIITKKPITAGDKELKQNKRSRSAKMRVAEKI
ncbi:MAG: 16S rRNA (cytosine(1402)-N(4))-methyltransferase RsmH [Ferruginibacter sp.]